MFDYTPTSTEQTRRYKAPPLSVTFFAVDADGHVTDLGRYSDPATSPLLLADHVAYLVNENYSVSSKHISGYWPDRLGWELVVSTVDPHGYQYVAVVHPLARRSEVPAAVAATIRSLRTAPRA